MSTSDANPASPPAPRVAGIRFYQPQDYRPEHGIGWAMRRIAASIGREIARRTGSDGPTSPQWLPLFKLYRGEASTVAELARSCQLDTSVMTRLLDRLEAKGLCRRCRSTTDRRVINVELTEAGRRCAQEIPAILCAVHNEHLAGFSLAEWQQLQDFLRRIARNGQGMRDASVMPGTEEG